MLSEPTILKLPPPSVEEHVARLSAALSAVPPFRLIVEARLQMSDEKSAPMSQVYPAENQTQDNRNHHEHTS